MFRFKVLTKPFIIIILATTTFNVGAQSFNTITKDTLLRIDKNIRYKHFKDLRILQFENDDSLKRKVTHSKKFDSSGRIIAEYFKDHQSYLGNTKPEHLKIYEYNNNGKIKVTTEYYNTKGTDDVKKYFYYYNDTFFRKLEVFVYKRQIKKEYERKATDDEPIPNSYYGKKHSWKYIGGTTASYNKKGQEIKLTAVNQEESSAHHSHYEYEYDSLGRVVLEKLFIEGKFIYDKKFEYNDSQTISFIVTYEPTRVKNIKTYDRTHKKIIMEQSGDKLGIYQYDQVGRISRYKFYKKDTPNNLTHIYNYK